MSEHPAAYTVAQPISASDWAEKVNFVKKQTAQAMDAVRPFVRCGCHKKLQMHHAYRCLYCGEWYCKSCAEVHFGKSVEQYRREHPVEGM